MKELPKGWQIVKTSEVGRLLRGVNYTKEEASNEPRDGYLPVLRGNNIQEDLIFNDLVFVQQKNISAEQILLAGDIVFAMSSGSKHLVGKTAKAKENFNGSFGAFCGVFRANEKVNKEFAAYFFKGPYYKKTISEISKGTNINNLKRDHILDLDFPLPPLHVQQAIVTKIEEIFSELDHGVEQLKTAQQQLKVYRQAVLKWAFEGRLTHAEVRDGELPEGWKWVKLGEVIEQPRYGTSKKCDPNSTGIGVLRIPNISDGYIDPSDLKYAKFDKKEIEAYRLKEGDLLTIRSNGSVDLVGKCALITSKDVIHLYAGYLIRLRPILSKINPRFLLNTMASSNLRNQIEEKAKSTSGVNNINTDELKSLLFPLPPLSEQHQIVSEIERRLSVCDKLEETIVESLKAAEVLRAGVLKRAFEGKLID